MVLHETVAGKCIDSSSMQLEVPKIRFDERRNNVTSIFLDGSYFIAVTSSATIFHSMWLFQYRYDSSLCCKFKLNMSLWQQNY